MALVHECLHKSDDLVHIDLQNYIETMSSHICAQFGAEQDIRFCVRAAGVEVDLDIAVSCGLILNELIANAYQACFPRRQARFREGQLRNQCQREADRRHAHVDRGRQWDRTAGGPGLGEIGNPGIAAGQDAEPADQRIDRIGPYPPALFFA